MNLGCFLATSRSQLNYLHKMQTTISHGCEGLKPLSTRRSAARAPTFGSTTSRRSSVQVFAKSKGKGKTAFRSGSGMPGQMEMLRREPPTPEVDPENAEFVMFVRVMKYKDPMLNVEVGPSLWVPVTIVKGNQVLNFIANAIKTEWGMRLYGRTLIWQMGSSLYQERAKLEKQLRKDFPPFSAAASSDFQYAFKLRDKENPKDWSKAEDVTVIPPESELGAAGIEVLKRFFSMDNLSTMFKAPA